MMAKNTWFYIWFRVLNHVVLHTGLNAFLRGQIMTEQYWTCGHTRGFEHVFYVPQLRQLYNVPMDSCKQNLLNDNPSNTIGNTLCQKAGLFVPNQSFQSFVKVKSIIFEGQRFAAFSKTLMLTILHLLPFVLWTNFEVSSKSLGLI